MSASRFGFAVAMHRGGLVAAETTTDGVRLRDGAPRVGTPTVGNLA